MGFVSDPALAIQALPPTVLAPRDCPPQTEK